MSLWIKAGGIITRGGKAILCPECPPCEPILPTTGTGTGTGTGTIERFWYCVERTSSYYCVEAPLSTGTGS